MNILFYQSKKELNLLDVEKSEFEMISILSNHIQDRRNFASEIQTTPLNLFDQNRKWKMFNINKVFDVIESTKGKVTFDLLAGDEIPYISAKKKDNGFDSFVSKEGNEEYISKGNGVVFINLGDGSGWIFKLINLLTLLVWAGNFCRL